MFASIVDYAVEALDEGKLLLVMNEIIGDFDKVNLNNKQHVRNTFKNPF